jgi:hypothetical protein
VADALTTIVTSAAVAAVVSSAAVAWNGWRDRVSRIRLQRMQENAETALRNLDRKHEAELRDQDRQQVTALREMDRQHESRIQELADLKALRNLKIERLRTNLVIQLDVALKLGTAGSSCVCTRFRHWQDLTESAKAAMAAGMGAPPVTGQRDAFEQVQERGKELAASVRKVIDSARATLAVIEQPIA